MPTDPPVLTLPDLPDQALSIRAKALLFHDPRSQAVLQQLERIAPSDATALVIGETGTGKELIARHIHKVSGRRGPFLAVNCGAFADNLIDAELFGHEAGAYTGASQSRAGWFEAADGGTLFLDEIGDLSLPLQVKLLRVLQERQVTRLGSRRTVPVDVRLVAATNVDLHKAVEAQHFRADLYYRLSVAPLHLPPLRERPGDVLPLARHFVAMYAQRLNLSRFALAEDAQAALLAYPWPGNIRELENAIHFGLIVCRDGVIRAADLKLATVPAVVSTPAAAVAAIPQPRAPIDDAAAPSIFDVLYAHFLRLAERGEPRLFHTVELALVRAVFAYCRENQVRSARTLGVSRNTLRTLLRQHGLLEVRTAAIKAASEAPLTRRDSKCSLAPAPILKLG